MVTRFLAVLGVLAVVVLTLACAHQGSGASSPSPAETQCAADHRRLKSMVDDDVRTGHLDVALRRASDALAACERELGPRHVATSRARVRRAWVMEKLGSYGDATEQAQLALGVFESELGDTNSDVASALQVMGSAALNSSDYVRAKAITLRLIALRERIGPPDGLAAQLGNLGLIETGLGRNREAIEALTRALDIARKNHPEESEEVALALAQLGETYRLLRNVEAAEPLLVEALAIKERVLGPEHDRVGTAANNLAALYHYGKKDLAKAEPLYRRALAIHRSHLPAGHRYTAQTLMNLGALLCESGRWEEGRVLFDEGVADMEKVVGRDAPEVKRARERLAQLGPHAPKQP